MNDVLIYDAATMSRTPFHAVVFAIGLTALALGVWIWNRVHGHPAGGLFTWSAGAAVLMWLVAGATEYEKRLIARKDPLQVEGPVHTIWYDRTRRSGKTNEYVEWEGFSVGAIGFSYVRNTDMNYFNNASHYRIELVEGLPLRIHYLEKRKDDGVVRYIVRVERLALK